MKLQIQMDDTDDELEDFAILEDALAKIRQRYAERCGAVALPLQCNEPETKPKSHGTMIYKRKCFICGQMVLCPFNVGRCVCTMCNPEKGYPRAAGAIVEKGLPAENKKEE